jgi:predicted SAM-dependent methyltransferase
MLINGQPLFRPSIWDYARVRKLYSTFVRGSLWQFQRAEVRAKDYLNVGCGPNTNNDLANLDYNWYPGVHVCWDITKPLPWGDQTLKGIYSEHCLEHITFADCLFAVKQFFRVLKPGGAVRIVVPDGELYIDLYNKARTGEKIEFPYPSEEEVTPMMSVNRIFQEFTHVFIYDEATMRLVMQQAGFVDIKRVSFMKGRDPKLLIDTEARAVESLYMEASKP